MSKLFSRLSLLRLHQAPGPEPEPAPPPPAEAKARKKPVRRRWVPFTSPLTKRILAVNAMAPIILMVGLLYLDRYKNELISTEIESLRIRAEMFAAALSEGAVIDNGFAISELSAPMARQMVRRLSQPARVRARLFDSDGELIADSRTLLATSTVVQVEDLPPPETSWQGTLLRRIYDLLTASSVANEGLPLYHERLRARANDYGEVVQSLSGEAASAVRATRAHKLVLSTAVPVQRYKQVLGVVMLSSSGDDIAESLYEVRLTILQAFLVALAITTLMSLYLAGTIAKPIRRLAAAADRVRRGQGRHHLIPDLSARKDEIGELSEALRDMTGALWRRMDAVEAFAADVAHEIKNPLTSLRSAVETCSRVTNPDQQRKLMAIIQDDVGRLDRLISDISDASRVDAELSRAEVAPVPVKALIEGLAAVYRDTGAAEGIAIEVEAQPDDDLLVQGIESRLSQVLRNLIGNALSFSPPGGRITLSARREGARIVATVADEGPGVPENKLEAIFERFYSERPAAEKFGTHSGLGLSISKQIAEAHGGIVSAANRLGEDGTVKGAVFTLSLPAAPAEPAKRAKGLPSLKGAARKKDPR